MFKSAPCLHEQRTRRLRSTPKIPSQSSSSSLYSSTRSLDSQFPTVWLTFLNGLSHVWDGVFLFFFFFIFYFSFISIYSIPPSDYVGIQIQSSGNRDATTIEIAVQTSMMNEYEPSRGEVTYNRINWLWWELMMTKWSKTFNLNKYQTQLKVEWKNRGRTAWPPPLVLLLLVNYQHISRVSLLLEE